MKITVLIDNAPSHVHADLRTEHGLSIYFEVDNRKWLVDVGASGKFAENAEKLGINIAEIDYLLLSHAHRDHTGGLAEFIQRNTKVKIYLSSHSIGKTYYSTRRGLKRDISPDCSVIENNKEHFVYVDSDLKVSERVSLVCGIPALFDVPEANRTLLVDDKQDDFRHEMAVCIDTPEGSVIISSCSHLGVLNTLAASHRRDVFAYIGGTHLIDSDDENQYETDEHLKEIAKNIKSLYPKMKLITGHCTGANARKILEQILAEKFISFYSGFTIEI
ncbi:MBL fold metallo-hydrolase [Bacteroides sp.]|uniref:MBL fold metallo-hydrolase n=1 Tax=Bacteroides sp. TaxID=29523 RepID=UPI001B75A53A|nr:MBL fold metallo-hydrolase [Bacteroides sp.]MBP6936136.1 MBL fold metallo-hydrolase [Bacteroides sp.]MBP9585580.1 MBL fold metallo-hydrolase [Bacteroides sp.]